MHFWATHTHIDAHTHRRRHTCAHTDPDTRRSRQTHIHTFTCEHTDADTQTLNVCTFSHTHSDTLTFSLIHSDTHFLSHTLSISLSHTHTHILSLCFSDSHTLFLSHSHTHSSPSLSHCLPPSPRALSSMLNFYLSCIYIHIMNSYIYIL